MDRNKLFTALFLLLGMVTQAQVVQSALPVKAGRQDSALAAPDAGNSQLVVFLAGKEKITALRYNSVLFFTDSLSVVWPETGNNSMAGYSFENDRAATLYRASDDYSKIKALHFDFAAGNVKSAEMVLPLKEETVITAFSDNNSFYIITMPNGDPGKNTLVFYTFRNWKYEKHTIDFSSAEFKNIADKDLTLKRLFEDYPPQKMAVKSFNSLPETAPKIKFYIDNAQMVFTLDHNAVYTQLLTINLTDYTFTEKLVQQPKLKNPGESNSFLLNNRLYQLKLNKEQLALSATDVATGAVIQRYLADSNETITFKNSDIVSQTGNEQPRAFKNTEKFLRRASNSDIALSVYETPGGILLTAGGVRSVMSAGNIIAGSAIIMVGGSEEMLDGMDPANTQLIFFESLFNPDFGHRPYRPGLLAIDYVSQYLATNERNMEIITVFPFGYDMLLWYYDTKAGEFILRKFMDDDF